MILAVLYVQNNNYLMQKAETLMPGLSLKDIMSGEGALTCLRGYGFVS